MTDALDNGPTFDELVERAAGRPLTADGALDGRTPCPVCGEPADAFGADEDGRIVEVAPCGHNPSAVLEVDRVVGVDPNEAPDVGE